MSGRSYCAAVYSNDCAAPAGFGVGGSVAALPGVRKSELNECADCGDLVCGPCSKTTADGRVICASHAEEPEESSLADKTDRELWGAVAYHQGNTSFGPIYKRAEALRAHPAMQEILRRTRESVDA